MKAIKKINNNVAICLDSKNHELIAFGKGIGFPQMPYEVELKDIERTFYNINEKYLGLLNELKTEMIEFTAKMIAVAQNHLEYELNPNLVLTLADHLSFAIEREKKGVYIQMPLVYDMDQQYPEEMRLSRYIVKKISEKFHVVLKRNELSGIAMAFISARVSNDNSIGKVQKKNAEKIISMVCNIVEEEMGISVNKKTFCYARFATHMNYLIDRIYASNYLSSENASLYDSLKVEYPKVDACVDKIITYLDSELTCNINNEERMYLILHVNRICMKEGL